jgi:hypothetical protein
LRWCPRREAAARRCAAEAAGGPEPQRRTRVPQRWRRGRAANAAVRA